MTWESFYLVCLIVGFVLSLLSLFGGGLRIHFPHVHFHAGTSGHGGHAGGRGGHTGPINFGTIAAFLAWFGGTGYLLTNRGGLWYVLALVVAFFSGLGGAAIVFVFLAKVLTHPDEALDPADYDMVGVLGKVSSSIRPSGTGEMIFSQVGVRRAAPARSEDDSAIPNGTEVVVTRYEHGIAYVRPWDELEKTTARLKESV